MKIYTTSPPLLPLPFFCDCQKAPEIRATGRRNIQGGVDAELNNRQLKTTERAASLERQRSTATHNTPLSIGKTAPEHTTAVKCIHHWMVDIHALRVRLCVAQPSLTNRHKYRPL